VFFNAPDTNCGIVTCGGLCPGLNDVIRSVVMTATYSYGVKQIYGFPYGYAGLAGQDGLEPIILTPELVERIHEQGGSLLGSSRGPQEMAQLIKQLQKWDIKILFAIGGDGTLKGAAALSQALKEQNLAISVIGIPKTIDNDINWIERSFGFATAVEEATRALQAAHAEARGAYNGIGLVKLMGRHSGSITAHASLANSDVNFCLIPEAPFTLNGFLEALEQRLDLRHHAVIALAEGAAQDLIAQTTPEKDASGNKKLADVGHYLKNKIENHFNIRQKDITIKYIDPSYIIRSLPANSIDSEFCLALGQHAVHAGMAGRTSIMIGYWNQHFTHVPLALATEKKKQLEPRGELWQRVLATTGQSDMQS
jgi:6-phosphofructokinase 1